MLALKIIGIIIGVLFLLSLVPIRVYISYIGYISYDISLRVRYGLFSKKIYPLKKKETPPDRKPEREPKTEKTAPKPESPEPIDLEQVELSEPEIQPEKTIKKEKTRSKTKAPKKDKSAKEKREYKLADIWELAKSSKGAMRIIKNHVIIDDFYAYVLVGGEDAHKTAVNFSHYSLIISNGISLVSGFFKLRLKEIVLLPDFLSTTTYREISTQVYVRPFFIIVAAFHLLIAMLKLNIKESMPQEQNKGGKKYESTKTNK